MSLFDILGQSQDPNGLAAVGEHLKKFYVENDVEKARINHAHELDDFYEGRGDIEMLKVIEAFWTDPKNRLRRVEFEKAGLSKYNNVIARIVQEKATVYSEPARRKVSKNDERYQAFLDLVQMDDAMRELDRTLAYHEDALLWYRVRITPAGDREPVLEVLTPASFWAVCHPKDRTLLVAIILDQRTPGARPEDPSFRVWTDDQTFVMNEKCEIFASSIEDWPLGRMPGVLCSTKKPGTKPRLLALCPSADLLAAQKMVRLQALNLVKESVSATKQTYLSGDTSMTPVGQTSDSEGEISLGEGVTATSVDRGMDLSVFRDNVDHVVDAAASNHGLPPSVMHQRDAASGAEIQLRRIPIRELRKQRIPVMRRIEARIARVMSLVNGSQRPILDGSGMPTIDESTGAILLSPGDLMDFAFSDEGFGVDFGEIQQPLTEIERDVVYETRKRLNLIDPLEEEMVRNPDIKTLDDAKKIWEDRMKRNTECVVAMKDLMAANGSLTSAPGDPNAQQNGAMGQPPSDVSAQVAKQDNLPLAAELKK